MYRYKFKKLKIAGAIVFIAGCLVNPILNDLAFFLVGSSVGFLGLLVGLEKTTKKSFTFVNKIELENDKIHIFIEDKKLEIITDKDSIALQKCKLEGKNLLILKPGVIVCEVNKSVDLE